MLLNLNHCVLLSCIAKKLSGYKMGKKFDGDALAVEQTNCTTKIGNAYVFYVLDD